MAPTFPLITGDHSADNQRVWQYIQSDAATASWLDAGTDPNNPVTADPDYVSLNLGKSPAIDQFDEAYTGTLTCAQAVTDINQCGGPPDLSQPSSTSCTIPAGDTVNTASKACTAALRSENLLPVETNFDQAASAVLAASDPANTKTWDPSAKAADGTSGWFDTVGNGAAGKVVHVAEFPPVGRAAPAVLPPPPPPTPISEASPRMEPSMLLRTRRRRRRRRHRSASRPFPPQQPGRRCRGSLDGLLQHVEPVALRRQHLVRHVQRRLLAGDVGVRDGSTRGEPAAAERVPRPRDRGKSRQEREERDADDADALEAAAHQPTGPVRRIGRSGGDWASGDGGRGGRRDRATRRPAARRRISTAARPRRRAGAVAVAAASSSVPWPAPPPSPPRLQPAAATTDWSSRKGVSPMTRKSRVGTVARRATSRAARGDSFGHLAEDQLGQHGRQAQRGREGQPGEARSQAPPVSAAVSMAVSQRGRGVGRK